MINPTICIAAPVRNREWILSYYLDHIRKIDYPKNKISLLWVVNHSTDHSERVLNECKRQNERDYKRIEIVNYRSSKQIPEYNRKSVRKVYKDQNGKKQEKVINPAVEYIYGHLADVRNFIFDRVKKDYQADFLLSVDSDILVSPDIIMKLLEAKKPITAGLIYNGYKFNSSEPWRYPNIMKMLPDGSIEHIANSYVKNAEHLQKMKIAKVDVSGAVIMLDKDAYTNTRYSWHAQGEDVGWAIDCKNKGYEIWVRYDASCRHMMDQQMLSEYLTEMKVVVF